MYIIRHDRRKRRWEVFTDTEHMTDILRWRFSCFIYYVSSIFASTSEQINIAKDLLYRECHDRDKVTAFRKFRPIFSIHLFY